MATKGKAALAAAIVALLGGGVWWFVRSREPNTPTVIGNALPKPGPDAGAAPPGLAAAGGMGVDPAVAGMADGPPPPPPDSTTATVEPRIRFRSGAVALSTEDARRLYAAAGIEPTVVLVSEEEFTGGTPGRTYAHLFSGETRSWQRSAVVDWTSGEPKVATAIEPGRWWAIVARPGLPPAFVRTSGDASGGLAFEVDLRPSGRATRVKLVDPETKEPVAGARVVPYVEFGDDAAFVAGPALVANHQGEVDLPLAEPGEDPWRPVSWWALAPGRAALVPPAWATASSKDAAFEVLLLRTATVSGHAWAADGKPAVGAAVSGMGRKGYGVSTVVGADGTYALEGVACTGAGGSKERVTLLPRGAGLDAVILAAQVKPGARVTLDLGAPADPAAKLGVLRGRLTAGGKPLAGFLVGLGQERFGETEADGTFRFEGLRPGPTQLLVMLGDPRVSDDAMLCAESLRIPDEGGEVVLDLDLPDGAIRVRVLDGATGAPVAGAWVFAGPEGEREDAKRFPGLSWKIGWSAVSNADGIAWMRGLPPDARFRLGAQGPVRTQGAARAQGVVAGSGAAPTEATLRLAPAGR